MKHVLPISLLALACMASFFPLPVAAAVVIRAPSDLLADAKVKELSGPYIVASQANVIYEQCGPSYELKPEQIAYQRDYFQKAAKDYVQAFHDAYYSRVGAEPDAAMVQGYTVIITQQQQQAVNATNVLIQNRGCEQTTVSKMFEYFEKLRYQQQLEEYKKATAPKRSIVPDTMTTPTTTKPITPTAGSQ